MADDNSEQKQEQTQEIKNDVKQAPVQTPKPKIKYPKSYFEEIQKIILNLQEKLSTKVFVYYVPEKHYITQEHPDFFLELLRNIKHQEKISLILYSRGGDSMACVRIADILRQRCNSFEVILLSSCYSAATQLALAADKIYFSPVGHLGPIDAQIVGIRDPQMTSFGYKRVSFSSFRRSYKLLESEGGYKTDGGSIETPYRTLFKYIHPLVFSQVDKLSTKSVTTAEIMMKMHPQSFESEDKIKWIANHLVHDYPSHDFMIRYEEAKNIGLPVEQISEDATFLLWELLKLYRAATKGAVTRTRSDIDHTEETEVIIETQKKRVFKRLYFDNIYSPAHKKWSLLGTNSNWYKIIPFKSDSNVPYKIIPIQSEEEHEVQKFVGKI